MTKDRAFMFIMLILNALLSMAFAKEGSSSQNIVISPPPQQPLTCFALPFSPYNAPLVIPQNQTMGQCSLKHHPNQIEKKIDDIYEHPCTRTSFHEDLNKLKVLNSHFKNWNDLSADEFMDILITHLKVLKCRLKQTPQDQDLIKEPQDQFVSQEKVHPLYRDKSMGESEAMLRVLIKACSKYFSPNYSASVGIAFDLFLVKFLPAIRNNWDLSYVDFEKDILEKSCQDCTKSRELIFFYKFLFTYLTHKSDQEIEESYKLAKLFATQARLIKTLTTFADQLGIYVATPVKDYFKRSSPVETPFKYGIPPSLMQKEQEQKIETLLNNKNYFPMDEIEVTYNLNQHSLSPNPEIQNRIKDKPSTKYVINEWKKKYKKTTQGKPLGDTEVSYVFTKGSSEITTVIVEIYGGSYQIETGLGTLIDANILKILGQEKIGFLRLYLPGDLELHHSQRYMPKELFEKNINQIKKVHQYLSTHPEFFGNKSNSNPLKILAGTSFGGLMTTRYAQEFPHTYDGYIAISAGCKRSCNSMKHTSSPQEFQTMRFEKLSPWLDIEGKSKVVDPILIVANTLDETVPVSCLYEAITSVDQQPKNLLLHIFEKKKHGIVSDLEQQIPFMSGVNTLIQMIHSNESSYEQQSRYVKNEWLTHTYQVTCKDINRLSSAEEVFHAELSRLYKNHRNPTQEIKEFIHNEAIPLLINTAARVAINGHAFKLFKVVEGKPLSPKIGFFEDIITTIRIPKKTFDRWKKKTITKIYQKENYKIYYKELEKEFLILSAQFLKPCSESENEYCLIQPTAIDEQDALVNMLIDLLSHVPNLPTTMKKLPLIKTLEEKFNLFLEKNLELEKKLNSDHSAPLIEVVATKLSKKEDLKNHQNIEKHSYPHVELNTLSDYQKAPLLNVEKYFNNQETEQLYYAGKVQLEWQIGDIHFTQYSSQTYSYHPLPLSTLKIEKNGNIYYIQERLEKLSNAKYKKFLVYCDNYNQTEYQKILSPPNTPPVVVDLMTGKKVKLKPFSLDMTRRVFRKFYEGTEPQELENMTRVNDKLWSFLSPNERWEIKEQENKEDHSFSLNRLFMYWLYGSSQVLSKFKMDEK